VGIQGIATILKMGASTVIRKIKSLAAAISKPLIPMNRSSFELDEVRT
jgi:hypothetical protein